MTHAPSITRQLLIGIGLPVFVIIVLIGGLGYLCAKGEIDEVYDAQLVTSANFLWRLSEDKSGPAEIRTQPGMLGITGAEQEGVEEFTEWRSYRVWRAGKLLITSENAPDIRFPARPAGFSEASRSDGHWRYFTLVQTGAGVVVESGENTEARKELIARVFWGLILPLTLAIPLIVLAIWRGIRWGLKDLRRFAETIQTRSSDDLSAIDTHTTPKELRALAGSVNGLMVKLEASLEQERLFTDNAAHELRTPLAALGVQADVILNAKTARERNQMVAELGKGVRRASRLLDQLLTLARIRHAPIQASALNVYEIASTAIKDIYPLAHARDIELSLSGDMSAMVRSKEPLLMIMLSNLLDNAIKYAPRGSAIAVAIKRSAEGLDLIIEDEGPGIPENEREKVFARFYRIQGTSATGSGLGLAIVRNIGERLSVGIHVFTPHNGIGLAIRLRFVAV